MSNMYGCGTNRPRRIGGEMNEGHFVQSERSKLIDERDKLQSENKMFRQALYDIWHHGKTCACTDWDDCVRECSTIACGAIARAGLER